MNMENREQIAVDSTKKMSMMQKKKYAYDALVKLAELDDCELCDNENMNADLATKTVFRYGSYADKVQAVKQYATYSILQCLADQG